jgi:outer membrane protein OmpA-like peptidoglycan-associated protein
MKYLRQLAPILGALAVLGAAPPLAAAGVPEARDGAALLAAQEAQLRIALAQTAAVVVHGDGVLGLRLPARLAFAPDRAELLPSGRELLDLLARSLREYGHTQIVVAVYTDAIGSEEFNRQQAQARAAVVIGYLQTRGVAVARLIARAVGEAAPLEAPNSPEGRDLNRRLELTVTPLSS